MKNLELKITIKNFNALNKILKEMDADYKGELRQIDTYYNCANGRLKTREINQRDFEVIFYQRPNIKESKESNYEVLPVQKSQIDKFKSFLKNLFGERVIVKKKRHLWIYRNTRIHIDKVEKLGTFLELETAINGNKNKAQKEHKNIIDQLDINKHKKYPGSYSDMLLAQG